MAALVTQIQQHQQACSTWLPFDFHGRVKSPSSMAAKRLDRRTPVMDDELGVRITHPFTANLHRLAQRLMADPGLGIQRRVVTERDRVLYLLGSGDSGVRFEIQLWPSVLYTVFATEHGTVYKPRLAGGSSNVATAMSSSSSRHLRQVEHALQDVLDQQLANDVVLQAQFREPSKSW